MDRAVWDSGLVPGVVGGGLGQTLMGLCERQDPSIAGGR